MIARSNGHREIHRRQDRLNKDSTGKFDEGAKKMIVPHGLWGYLAL